LVILKKSGTGTLIYKFMKRRRFIQGLITGAMAPALLNSCKERKKIKGSIVGASAHIGHLVRDKKFETASIKEKKKIVIVGGGVSGLSAARYLVQQGITDLLVLDLEKNMGGNAAASKNNLSAYPLGAHYIPTPNNDLTEYLSFLKELDVIKNFDENGLPVYNEYHLCFDSQERLFINGQWQEGLIPHHAVSSAELKIIEKFLQQMDQFREAKGTDGKYAFAIPVDLSSKDSLFVQLDSISMKTWMEQQHFTSDYLHWYVNYCCRDDFGTNHHQISAWAGIHYFAGRKGKGSNAEHGDVLTWPEGNHFLIEGLKRNCQPMLRNNELVVNIKTEKDHVVITCLNSGNHQLYSIVAEHCIIATPQFVAARLLKDEERLKTVNQNFNYVPWMVANIRTRIPEEKKGTEASWDNVIFQSDSLGYVDASHQLLQQKPAAKNFTYYLPLTKDSCSKERKAAQLKSHEEWVELVLSDLEKVHPDIREKTEEININLWGHAMIQPLPGIIHGSIRKQLSASIKNRIHFAHTDLSGVSIFEEGFYQGIQAAKKTIEQLS
jgi:protoporphyrinogen oxidase